MPLAKQSAGNQAALAQFVRDGGRHAIEERRPHLRIVPEELHRALLRLRLLPCRGLAFLLGQGLAGRGLVMRDDFLGNLLHDRGRFLRAGNAHVQQQGHAYTQDSTSRVGFLLSHGVECIWSLSCDAVLSKTIGARRAHRGRARRTHHAL